MIEGRTRHSVTRPNSNIQIRECKFIARNIKVSIFSDYALGNLQIDDAGTHNVATLGGTGKGKGTPKHGDDLQILKIGHMRKKNIGPFHSP